MPALGGLLIGLMARYGSDRPDIRFGLEITDLGEALAATEFKVFSGALGSGGVVRGLNAGAREVPRKDLDHRELDGPSSIVLVDARAHRDPFATHAHDALP